MHVELFAQKTRVYSACAGQPLEEFKQETNLPSSCSRSRPGCSAEKRLEESKGSGSKAGSI